MKGAEWCGKVLLKGFFKVLLEESLVMFNMFILNNP